MKKMDEFWDDKYRGIQTRWGMEPADSAVHAKDFFLDNQIRDILIPGVGYGRNAGIFLENGIRVTGIEISGYAIRMAREECHLDFPIHKGSVTRMPFDDHRYEGIFCYALLHLLSKPDRKRFIRSCYEQLKPGGYLIFTVISKLSNMYGSGRRLSDDRYELSKGLMVYFYDPDSARKEFADFEIIELNEIDEPVRHSTQEPPMKFLWIMCRRNP